MELHPDERRLASTASQGSGKSLALVDGITSVSRLHSLARSIPAPTEAAAHNTDTGHNLPSITRQFPTIADP